ncbi:DUF2911 domain-containing protein [Winogradskyella sp. A3E31]|uniref:DUF2911 domain-containing protein n=1 Tax=Winogradskyella sp. A3E31 TaxID=3349637 RepID=UPI00398B5CF1
MKKLVLMVFAFTLMVSVNAQIETPQPSPFQKVEQKVGLTDITLEYSRPAMRGRTIFGDLVPFGSMWRLGANANTKITFSDPVTIDGQELKAGSYAVYATPNESSWDIVFYTDSNNGGLPREWDDAKVAAKTTVETQALPMDIQSFTMTFDDVTSSSVHLGMLWENTYVGVPIEVPTDKKVDAAINRVMSGPSAGDYYNAAVYYASEGKDINKAGEWMEKAMSMVEKPAFWQLRQQSLIYAKMGKKDKAIATAKKSLAGAKDAGNEDYIKMNKDSLKEWGAM